MSAMITAFENIIHTSLKKYLNLSKDIDDTVFKQSVLVNNAFNQQLDFLHKLPQLPSNSLDTINQFAPINDTVQNIVDVTKKNCDPKCSNYLSMISEGIFALGWVLQEKPASFVNTMLNASEYFGNRILKEKQSVNKDKDWVNAWYSTLNSLEAYVKKYHTPGVSITAMTSTQAGGAAPPPPPPPPPPPELLHFNGNSNADSKEKNRSALFAEINQGEDITKNLKRITADMQTHKTPLLTQNMRTNDQLPHQPQKTGSTIESIKTPVMKKDGKKWLIEHQNNNHSIIVSDVEMNNVVYLFKCVNSTITVKGKINSIMVDSCKKTSIVFDSLVSSIEFINCASVQMQVFGNVPTISVDKTDGCQMYLSSESLNVEIVSSKSSEMNVMIPKSNGDFLECPIPEQFKTTINGNKGINTVIIDNKM